MDTAIWRFEEDNIRLGMTGVMLLADNREALAARVLAARSARSSLDLMYYLWHDDRSGRMLMDEVFEAAERGVHVRMLLDDINPRHCTAEFAALGRHPNIELKLFNPTRIRGLGPLRTLELVLRRFAMTRRMHNKALIVDDRAAIVGGRNIGDAYFDAADTNFRDLDLLMIGRGVAETRRIFDAFWDFEAAKPIGGLRRTFFGGRPRCPTGSAEARHAKLENVLRGRSSLDELIAGSDALTWTRSARVVSDPPQKVLGKGQDAWLIAELVPLILTTRQRLDVSSPYFIPGPEGTAILTGLVDKGAEVTVLTNSLAATDVAAVHGAYANYRGKLLRCGINLFELQPYRGRKNISVLGSKGASLHTKAFVVDDAFGFVGSLNFDPRSVSLNTEMGVVFEDAGLVAELRRVFRSEQAPDSSYRVTLSGTRLRWTGERNGRLRDYRHEPEVGIARRLLAAVVGWLPVESEL
jgi:putative cardiolipin synthase